jgi:hypothetical protein
VDLDEVVHEPDSVCVCVWDHVDAGVEADPNGNANAPVYDLVNVHATVDVDAYAPARW